MTTYSRTLALTEDLTIRRLGFGAMQQTGAGVWGDVVDRNDAITLLRKVRDSGFDLIDTADAYGPDTNESLIADALWPYDGLTITTKGGCSRQGPGEWTLAGRPDRLRAACEASLKRLRVDCIDLYQLHAPDPTVPYEESVGALSELKAAGKIRHIGLSNISVEQLSIAEAIAPIVSVQNRYNIGERESEDVLDACEQRAIAFMAHSPIASGVLADDPPPVVERIASKRDVTVTQLSLAWLLHRSPVMVAIPGTSSISHLAENAAADTIALSLDDIAELELAAGADDRSNV